MYKLSYWNVDTQKIGKLKEDKNEMKEVQLNILGIGEIWYAENCDFIQDNFQVIHNGSEKSGKNHIARTRN